MMNSNTFRAHVYGAIKNLTEQVDPSHHKNRIWYDFGNIGFATGRNIKHDPDMRAMYYEDGSRRFPNRVRTALDRLEKDGMITSRGYSARRTYALANVAATQEEDERQHANREALKQHGSFQRLRDESGKALIALSGDIQNMVEPRHLAIVIRQVRKLRETMERMSKSS